MDLADYLTALVDSADRITRLRSELATAREVRNDLIEGAMGCADAVYKPVASAARVSCARIAQILSGA